MVIKPVVAEKSGRIIKFTGDGFLVEFPSVQDAVACAIAMQENLASSSLKFRMGINVGDITDDGGDVHGEGVNIAARLEALAEPGGICISGDVYNQVRNRVAATFKDLGEQEVKHVSRPVRVYAVNPATTVTAEYSGAPVLPLPKKPSIAVLPFENMSGDPEQDYFADGISEDVITDLSKVSALFVIARNSSFTYKGRAVDIRDVSRELGVKYVLEGSVRKSGNRVRITAQLIDGREGGHVWAERYDRDLEDIFAVQDEITRTIVEALKIRLTEAEQSRIGTTGSLNIEAYDYTLRGRDLFYRFTPETNIEAQNLFRKAIELDEKFALAYSGLSFAKFVQYTNGWSGADETTLEEGFQLASKAVRLAPADPIARRNMGLGHTWKKDLDRGIIEMDRAIELDPNFSEAHAGRSYVLSFAGRPDDAIASLQTAMRLNPMYPDIWLHFMGHAEFMRGDYEAVIAPLQRRIRLRPETDISRVLLASTLGHLGRIEEAQATWAEVMKINPGYSIKQKARVLPYKNPNDWNRFLDGLRKAGLPED